MSGLLTTSHVLLVANAAGALLSGGSALVGLARPRLALPAGEPVTAGVRTLVLAYAARAVPLCLVTVVLLATGDRTAVAPLLLVGGLAQVGDAWIGWTRRIPGMIATTLALTALHLGSAWWFAAH
jgi:hypothetical protein